MRDYPRERARRERVERAEREADAELRELLGDLEADDLAAGPSLEYFDPNPPTRAQRWRNRAVVLTAMLLIGGISIGSAGNWASQYWWDIPGETLAACTAAPNTPTLTATLDTVAVDSVPVVDTTQTFSIAGVTNPWAPGNVRVTDTTDVVLVAFMGRVADASSITRGAADTFTLIKRVGASPLERVSFWRLTRPDTGTQALSVVPTGTGERVALVSWIVSGVDSLTASDTSKVTSATATTFTISTLDTVAMSFGAAAKFVNPGGGSAYNAVSGWTQDLNLQSNLIRFGAWHAPMSPSLTVTWAGNEAYAAEAVSLTGVGQVGSVTLAATLAGSAYSSSCAPAPGHQSSSWWITNYAGDDTVWADFNTADSLTSWDGAALDSLSPDSAYVARLTYTDANGASGVAADTFGLYITTPTLAVATLSGDTLALMLGSMFAGSVAHDSSRFWITQDTGSLDDTVFIVTSPDSLERYTGAGPLVPDSAYVGHLLYFGGVLTSGEAVDSFTANSWPRPSGADSVRWDTRAGGAQDIQTAANLGAALTAAVLNQACSVVWIPGTSGAQCRVVGVDSVGWTTDYDGAGTHAFVFAFPDTSAAFGVGDSLQEVDNVILRSVATMRSNPVGGARIPAFYQWTTYTGRTATGGGGTGPDSVFTNPEASKRLVLFREGGTQDCRFTLIGGVVSAAQPKLSWDGTLYGVACGGESNTQVGYTFQENRAYQWTVCLQPETDSATADGQVGIWVRDVARDSLTLLHLDSLVAKGEKNFNGEIQPGTPTRTLAAWAGAATAWYRQEVEYTYDLMGWQSVARSCTEAANQWPGQ